MHIIHTGFHTFSDHSIRMFRLRHPTRGKDTPHSTTRLTSKSGTAKTRSKKFKRKTRHAPKEEITTNSVSNVIEDVLSIEGIVERVMSYLPSRQRHRTCILVSKLWRKVVMNGNQLPLSLRIDDTGFDRASKSKGSCCYDHDGDETFVYPLYAIGNLPSWVATRTTKLVLVLRFARKHASKYDLNDFLTYQGRPWWFLDRFRNLQDLTIISEFAADQFVSILSPPPTTIRRGIPSLKRIHYEETNVSNWRNSYLKSFVELAPNLEILKIRENMRWKWKEESIFFRADEICDLLPLSGSLRELVLFNRPNIRGNFSKFLQEMPFLESWDIYNSLLDMGDYPRTKGRLPQTFEDNTCRLVDLNEHPHFVHYARNEAEFLLMMQDLLVPWLLGLDDANLHPWKNQIPHMVGYLDAIMKEYFETDDQFFENRPLRPYRLPTLANLLEVNTSTIEGSLGGGRKHSNYCYASRNKTKLKNYYRAVRPCMELYYDEFLYYCDSHSFGIGYSKLQKLYQRRELNRLVKRITRVEDQYRKGTVVWFGQASKCKDFSVLV